MVNDTSIENTGRFQARTLRSKSGLSMTVINFGARIMSLHVPDRHGNVSDIVLGYDRVGQYEGGNPYFGAIIGRYANRIAAGRFKLDGTSYSLPVNNGKNSLHGGVAGLHNVFWSFEASAIHNDSVSLTYHSSDGEEGYPGNMNIRVTYTLNENDVVIDYRATTDKKSIINLTSHGYFNLAGEGNGDILKHSLAINADYFTPVNEDLIPTGERKSIADTPFDFRTAKTMGARIDDDDPQLRWPMGYDHNWILNKNSGELSLAATVYEEGSGRVMKVLTTEPGLQFYSGNFLEGKGTDVGKGDKPYGFRSAFCLEAQHFPNSPNEPSFPATIINPGKDYSQQTIYRFSVGN